MPNDAMDMPSMTPIVILLPKAKEDCSTRRKVPHSHQVLLSTDHHLCLLYPRWSLRTYFHLLSLSRPSTWREYSNTILYGDIITTGCVAIDGSACQRGIYSVLYTGWGPFSIEKVHRSHCSRYVRGLLRLCYANDCVYCVGSYSNSIMVARLTRGLLSRSRTRHQLRFACFHCPQGGHA